MFLTLKEYSTEKLEYILQEIQYAEKNNQAHPYNKTKVVKELIRREELLLKEAIEKLAREHRSLIHSIK